MEELEECCSYLKSSKIMERKKGADLLQNLMENPNVIRFLNKGGNNSPWNIVVESVHKLLTKVVYFLFLNNIDNCSSRYIPVTTMLMNSR